MRGVREGIRHFSAGEYDAAREAFTAANDAEPDEPTISFDRACTEAAAGEFEKAREFFQQSSLARDIGVAAESHYNLGCLAAQQAKTTLGDEPAAANPEQREQATSQLLTAVGHYRDCLRLDPEHANARHNLELIRLFLKQMQSLWEQRDREQAREEMNLLEFLALIEQKQEGLRETTRELDQQLDSPQRRQWASETQESQRKLEEEIEPLQKKIGELFSAPSTGNTGVRGPPADQAQQAEQLLRKIATEAGDRMRRAAGQIDDGSFQRAADLQREVLDRFHQIYLIVAPFPNVLQRAIERQESLVDKSEAAIAADPEDPSGTAATASPPDHSHLAWRQSRVTDWSRMLTLKAAAELESLRAESPSTAAEGAEDEAAAEPVPTDSEAAANAPQGAAMKESLERAQELGPLAEQRSASAAGHLREEALPAALPDQQETLRLLREIAEPLSKQDQQQDNSSRDDQDKRKGDQQEPEQSQQQDQQNRESPQDQQPPPQPRSADASSSQESREQAAMSVLQRAREREREHRELQKELRRRMGIVVEVEKDW